jgi:hypothetical protein
MPLSYQKDVPSSRERDGLWKTMGGLVDDVRTILQRQKSSISVPTP